MRSHDGPDLVREVLVGLGRSSDGGRDTEQTAQPGVVPRAQSEQPLHHLERGVGPDQGALQGRGLALAAKVGDQGPEDVAVEPDTQAVGLQPVDPIEVGEIEGVQGLDLFGAEVHGAQRMLVALGQTAHRVEQDRGGELRLLGTAHRGAPQSETPVASAVRWILR